MSNRSLGSINSIRKKDKPMDSIPCRIEFIKELLRGKNLNSLVDFERTDTEYFINNNHKEEDQSGNSYDTRIILQKRCKDFTKTIMQLGGEQEQLEYIKSGTTGHTFRGSVKDEYGLFQYGVKVVAYPKSDRYGHMYDIRRPENAEIMMIKVLSYFVIKRQTPHIVLPIGTFDTDITLFTTPQFKEFVGKKNEKYKDFIDKYNKGDYYDKVSILISEWANRGDLLEFIRQYYDKPQFTAMHWKAIFFQLISVLAIIQSKYPAFRHNDLKANNVLVQKIIKQDEHFTYRIAKKQYRVNNIGYQIKLWDFDFACIPGIVDNLKVEQEWTKKINVIPKQNRYYDIHYFFNTLIKKGFCSGIMTSEKVPQEVKDFINRILPPKYQKFKTQYVHEKGRLLVEDEFVTPLQLLEQDPYFEEFRISNDKPNNIPINNVNLSKFLVSDTKKYIDPVISGGKKKNSKKNSKKKNSKKNSKKNIKKKDIAKKIHKKERTISDDIRMINADDILLNSS